MSLSKPPVPVHASDRGEVIDLVNRLNRAFDQWDLTVLMDSFTDDARLHHPRGVVQDRAGFEAFYTHYRPLTLGARRACINHVVDALPDGSLMVTSLCLIFRIGPAELPAHTHQHAVTENHDGLPAIHMLSTWRDHCRRQPDGQWRIAEKWVEDTVINRQLEPSSSR